MSYQVLARKWRPGTFREMVGQQHVLRALINALDHDRLHHAYLFTGTRGVGKTTVARILAKCLNCEVGVSSEPCGDCASCCEIAEGRSIDLLEVDAASRTKVEDTRELLENVQYAPSRSRFKIYLIDEVHMLSNHSFNALLKTLEEPPPHAKFLLATTDPQKLPATVLSRCLQFNLKNMVPEQIVEHLSHVLERESVGFDQPALGLLARAAEGSMRDALSLTDQAIAFGSGAVREAEVRDMLGTVDRGRVLTLVAGIIEGNPAKVLTGVQAIAEHAPDYGATLDDLIAVFHQITIAQMVPEATDPTWSEQQAISDLAATCSLDDSQLWYQFAVNGRRDLAVTQDPRIGLEMTLLRMIAFRPADIIMPPGAADGGETLVGSGVNPGKKSEPPARPVGQADAPNQSAAREHLAPDTDVEGSIKPSGQPIDSSARTAAGEGERPVVESASTEALTNATSGANRSAEVSASTKVLEVNNRGEDDLPTTHSWPEYFDRLGLVGITYTIALHCELVAVEGRCMRFVLDHNNANLFQAKHVRALEAAFEQLLGHTVEVFIDIGEVGEGTAAQRIQRLAQQRQQAAEQAIAEDPVLASVLQRFDGEIIDGSIRPLHDALR